MILLMVVLLFSCVSLIHAAEISGVIIEVKDGDSVTLLDEQVMVPFKVRLEDIDAPEDGQPYYKVSKRALSSLCFGKHVSIRFKKIDHFGRIVGKVVIDGKDVQLEMLRMGMAWHYKTFSKVKEYAEAEQKARELKAGLWSDPNPVPPWKWRAVNKKTNRAAPQ